MVQKTKAEDAAIDAAVEQLQAGGVKQVIQYTEDVKAVMGENASITLDSTAGIVPLYDRATGVMSATLSDQLKANLKKRYPNDHHMAGQLVFSLQPTIEPPRGNVKCLLHPEHPDRAHLDSIGLRGKFCPAAHIASEFDLEAHMEHRHHREWDTIQRERDHEREEEGRQLLRQQTELLAKMGGQEIGDADESPSLHYCRVEGCERFFDSERGRDLHERKEHKS